MDAERALASVRNMEALVYGTVGDLANTDIMALAVTVMMEAAKDEREDLIEITAEVRAINAAKERLRELHKRVRCDVDTNLGDLPDGLKFADAGLGGEAAYHSTAMPSPDRACDGGLNLVTTDLHPAQITSVAQLREVRDRLKTDLDSMSELGEVESLRLQIAIDRLSKMMSTLSNLLKKISDTANSITQNIK
jgi:hypothetical protein